MVRNSILTYAIVFYVIWFTLISSGHAESSTILGSWYGVEPLEIMTADQLAGYIYNCSTASAYTSYDWYGSSTTKDNIGVAASGNGDTYSVSFYVGHGRVRTEWIIEDHYDIVASNGVWVDDGWIYPHAADRNVRFVFLWSCYQGNTIGGTHFWTGNYGMPYCWLHTTNLTQDGYGTPDENGYTFIGFYGPGPLLSINDLGYRAGYRFAGHFYEYAMISGKSINQALDYAASHTWGQNYNFSNCIYRTGYTLDGEAGHMVVYGDGTLEIGSATSTPPLPSPPVASGCPTLLVWDGHQYVDYGVIDIHNPTGEDVVRRVPVLAQDVGIRNHVVTFRLREGWEGLKFSESVIDQVKLYAVDDSGHRRLCPLAKAEHSRLGNVLLQLLFSDDYRVQALLLEKIDLAFIVPYQNIQSFIFVIEGCNVVKEIC
jgi:hypothetical protein